MLGRRYVPSDPIGLAGGIHTYGYANASPLRWTDRKRNIAIAAVTSVGGVVITIGCALTPGYRKAVEDAARSEGQACEAGANRLKFRYPRGWRDLGEKWPAWLRQLDRIRNIFKGASGGAAGAAASFNDCTCQQ